MGDIRPFERDHLDRVITLLRESFPGFERRPLDEVTRKFRERFLDSPYVTEKYPSLVYLEDDGSITGFIGTLPQRFHIDGRELDGLLLADLMVGASCSLGMAGYHITKEAMGFGQDFTFTNRNGPNVAPMWRRLKSVQIWPYCVEWSIELQPSRLAYDQLSRRMQGKKRVLAPLVAAARPAYERRDAKALRLRDAEVEPPEGTVEPLDAASLIECFEAMDAPGRLRLASDREKLQWVLDYLANYPARGELVARVVRDKRGKARGWYAYFVGPAGWHDVVSLEATDPWRRHVVEHLRRDSLERGGVRLFGETCARTMDPILDAGGTILPRKWGFYANSSDPAVMESLRTGEAILSGFEDERTI